MRTTTWKIFCSVHRKFTEPYICYFHAKDEIIHRILKWLSLCKVLRTILLIGVSLVNVLASNCTNKQKMERIEAAACRRTFSGLFGGGEMMERDVRVTGDTADIERGQLLIIKRCLCPIAFCTYKCTNVGLFTNIVVFSTFICHEWNKLLQVDSGLFFFQHLAFL